MKPSAPVRLRVEKHGDKSPFSCLVESARHSEMLPSATDDDCCCLLIALISHISHISPVTMSVLRTRLASTSLSLAARRTLHTTAVRRDHFLDADAEVSNPELSRRRFLLLTYCRPSRLACLTPSRTSLSLSTFTPSKLMWPCSKLNGTAGASRAASSPLCSRASLDPRATLTS